LPLKPKLVEKILKGVHEKEIVQMCCDVINIPSPTGYELEMAKYMRHAFEETGLRVTWQEVEEGRANVIGLWEGAGNGKNLMFNGHMDTSNTGQEPFLTGIGYKPHAVVKNGVIYGLGIYNMKGALICYTQAVRALQRAGVKIDGSIMIAAVAGEIEKTQFGDDYHGREYRGYGFGSHYMVCHGIAPDMCILGEPTDMKLVLGHYGSLWVRISTQGTYVHTAFGVGREKEHSIRRMYDVLGAVYEWIPEWNAAASYGSMKGFANVGGIAGGYAWRASRSPAQTDIYIDLRVPPSMTMQQARHAAKEMFINLERRFPGYGLEFETYVSVPGAEISENHELVKTIEAKHKQVMHKPPERDSVLWCSDASVMSRFGIESLNYGPSSGPRDAEGEKVAIKTFVDITKIYALAAAEICGAQ
jgi:acetylornithine deacetylase/succinyl-diaminopimelate desuccinylase-like protein